MLTEERIQKMKNNFVGNSVIERKKSKNPFAGFHKKQIAKDCFRL